MKASEFIEPSCFLVVNYIVKDKFSDIKDKNNDKVEINISYELIEELDKRFIDREELKKKIYNIFLTKKDSSELKHIVDFRKEILELIDK